METNIRSKTALFLWVFVAALLSQNLMIPVMCRTFEDQKTYYSPDPHSGGSHKSHSHGSPPSSHGSGGSYGHTPPSHGSHGTPSHGSGGSYTPPSHGSDGSYTPTPSTPTGGGSGGYYHSPPSSGGGGHSTPVTITPPSSPTIDYGTPTVPGITTPSTPLLPDPNTPSTPLLPDPNTPSTPLLPDPNTPPLFTGTCNYWSKHPQLVWGLLGWWGTVGSVFGVASTPTFGTSLSLQQALTNTRNDGFGALYREGTASLLNSMVNKKFPFSIQQVKDGFATALVSDKAAAAQAELFKLANEGRFKP